ncbi:MAG: hypothetical protein JXB49_33245 [Bacteroidales bacterium]|nr:hypothetical protein [Bacteroidales bacterium]
MSRHKIPARSIYPLSKENILALIKHHFQGIYPDSIHDNQIKKLTEYEFILGELEILAELVSKHTEYLKKQLGTKGYYASNILSYMIEIVLVAQGVEVSAAPKRREIINALIFKTGLDKLCGETRV